MSDVSIRRAGSRRLAAVAFCVISLTSCYSSSYRRELIANVALISDLSDKLADYCRSDFELNGSKLSSEEMGEFYYALKKAQSFAAMDKAESGSQSYRSFNELLVRYAAFVKEADQYRLANVSDSSIKATLDRDHNLVKIDAARVLSDLDQSKRTVSQNQSGRPRFS